MTDLELVTCVEGDRWFPWNYDRKSASGRVAAARFGAHPGLVVLNATRADGRVLGSCALRLGYPHSEHVLGDEEYQYGAASAGPAYFWPDDEKSPWILIVKSFWVRPADRRLGIARLFAEYAPGFGLPGYLGFANEHMEAFFNREYRPTRKTSRLQKKIAQAARSPADDFEPSGESYEVGYSDSAFAADRCFGYALSPWLDSWGPEGGPYDAVPATASESEWDSAAAAFDAKPSYAAGSIEGWVFDAEAMLAYATVRRFLRTLQWRDFTNLDKAAEELFVVDLSEQPRGLRRFSALVSPVEMALD